MRTEIYINKTLIDVTDDLAMSLNFAIADIKNPDKRNSSYSKTITIPGSKTNNKLFSYIFEIGKEALTLGDGVNFAPDFNPNLKADCKIYIDTLLQLNGYVQLLDVKINGDKIEYEIAVFGQLANLITSIDGINLTDLDFSEYDHLFTKTNQRNSWEGTIIKNGSSYSNFTGIDPIGEGYVYPLINYGYTQNGPGINPNEFDVKHLYPSIYAKNYIDKIFAKGKFTYTSDFFDSLFFKRLIIPFSGEVIKLSYLDVDSRKFQATTVPSFSTTNNTSGADANKTQALIFSNDSTGGSFDPSDIYNTTLGKWTVNKNGTYDLTFVFQNTIQLTPDNLSVDRLRISGSTNYQIRKNGGEIIGVDLGNEFADHNLSTPYTIALGVVTLKWTNLELNIGDAITLECVYKCDVVALNTSLIFPEVDSNITHNISFVSATLYNTPIINPLLEGDTFLMNSAIPRSVSSKDFFLSIVKMFNLYVSPDPDNDTNLLIEPQKDFYTSNTVVDWSDKLDLSKQIDIKPVSEIEGKEYIFSYKPDKDYANQNHQDKYGKVYGERDIIINNDFVKGKKELGIIFSPTPSYGNPVTGNNMVIPTMYKLNTNGTVSPTSGNPRILYYGGVRAMSGSWTYKANSGDSVETTYPYAGNLDNPYAPSVDLLFDIPEVLYYKFTGTYYTTNNLYNVYHKQFIEEITDKDSKLVIAYFRLRPLDIYNLSFKNFIHVNGINYRLNRIIDHNPLKEDSTKVELAKIKRGVPFTGVNTDIDTVFDPANFGLIEGGEDEVRDLSATSPVHLVDSGADVVIGIGSYNNINLVNGGLN